jgi:transcriptional regulator with XRE-family HTH domain
MCAQSKEHLIAFRKNSAFLVRRARLLLGETQSEFADHFGVETSTVSRWERGLVKPRPRALAEITKMATKTDPFRSEDVIRASPVIKFLAPLNDLTTPLMVSKGLIEVLGELGYTFKDFLTRQGKELWARPNERIYGISTGQCLRDIQKDPRWLRGEIAYAEFRGYWSSCVSMAERRSALPTSMWLGSLAPGGVTGTPGASATGCPERCARSLIGEAHDRCTVRRVVAADHSHHSISFEFRRASFRGRTSQL